MLSAMIYDLRTYTCKHASIQKQLQLYEEYCYDLQKKYLGEPVLYGIVGIEDV